MSIRISRKIGRLFCITDAVGLNYLFEKRDLDSRLLYIKLYLQNEVVRKYWGSFFTKLREAKFAFFGGLNMSNILQVLWTCLHLFCLKKLR